SEPMLQVGFEGDLNVRPAGRLDIDALGLNGRRAEAPANPCQAQAQAQPARVAHGRRSPRGFRHVAAAEMNTCSMRILKAGRGECKEGNEPQGSGTSFSWNGTSIVVVRNPV